MADVNRGNRPLSPHLQIYKPQLHSAMSIFFRMAGVGLSVGGVLMVAWFLAAATGPDAFAMVDGLITSFIGDLVMLGCLAALIYHLLNGLRHLVWDFGYWFDMDIVRKSGFGVLGGTALLTLIVVLLA
ncbi:MAG: succinate dehydrogenase, cytochrome b556 subunit [Pseudomonadota bacterium]